MLILSFALYLVTTPLRANADMIQAEFVNTFSRFLSILTRETNRQTLTLCITCGNRIFIGLGIVPVLRNISNSALRAAYSYFYF